MVNLGMDELGVDYAAVDSNAPPNCNQARDAGVRFVGLKKAQHVYPDAHYARDVDRWRAAGVTVMPYFFPGWGPRAAGAKAQIAACRNAPGDIIPNTDMPLCIDVEQSAEWTATGWSKAQCVAFLEQLVREVEDQVGCTPAIYTSYNQWYSLGCPSMPWIAECPLWGKTAYRLSARQPVDQVVPPTPHVGLDALHDARNYYRIPDPWANTGWAIQQFQGDAIGFPGFDRTVDVNRFNVMRLGSRDPHVSWLQRKLNTCSKTLREKFPPDTENFLVLVEDGDFGHATETAVRALQGAAGLSMTGIVDVQTFARIAWS